MHYYHSHFKDGTHETDDPNTSKIGCCTTPNLVLLGRTNPNHASAITLGYLLYCTSCEELHKTL